MFEAILMEQLQAASQVVNQAAPIQVARSQSMPRPITPACFHQEAKRQGLEPIKLLSILMTEKGRVGQFVRNTNGSYDIGPMQINTIHLPEIARHTRLSTEAVAAALAYDGCFNVSVAAWMLRKRTNEVGGDFWYGIGRYHSKTPEHRNRYILRVHKNMTSVVNKINSYGGRALPSKEL